MNNGEKTWTSPLYCRYFFDGTYALRFYILSIRFSISANFYHVLSLLQTNSTSFYALLSVFFAIFLFVVLYSDNFAYLSLLHFFLYSSLYDFILFTVSFCFFPVSFFYPKIIISAWYRLPTRRNYECQPDFEVGWEMLYFGCSPFQWAHQRGSRRAGEGDTTLALWEAMDERRENCGFDKYAAKYSALPCRGRGCVDACYGIWVPRCDDRCNMACEIRPYWLPDGKCGCRKKMWMAMEKHFELILLNGRQLYWAVRKLKGQSGQEWTKRPLCIIQVICLDSQAIGQAKAMKLLEMIENNTLYEHMISSFLPMVKAALSYTGSSTGNTASH